MRSFLPIQTDQREPPVVPLYEPEMPYSSMPTAMKSGWPVEIVKAISMTPTEWCGSW